MYVQQLPDLTRVTVYVMDYMSRKHTHTQTQTTLNEIITKSSYVT